MVGADSMVSILNFVPTIQGMEWIILVVVIVIVLFGAKKLPELARSVGKAKGEYEKGLAEAELEVKKMKEKLKESADVTKLSTAATGAKAGETVEVGDKSGETELQRLIRIAKELGIETEGKSEAELKEEIAKAMLR
jgi:sec-independent protein translocase protein TatA